MKPRPGWPLALLAAAVALSGSALAWLLVPGRAPAHPYMLRASTAASYDAVPSRSYERGLDAPAVPAAAASVSGSASPSSATASPLGIEQAQQAAVAAAALAGTDAAQITADGFALTSDEADPGAAQASPSDPPPTAAGLSDPPSVEPAPPPSLLQRSVAADVVGASDSSDTVDGLKAAARAQMLAYGYPPDQWGCLDSVITRESGWHVTATNIRSGAYGLPQSKPATKMATAGPDWQTNPHTQLAWMLDYVHRRYADPCGAWAHELSDGWY